MFTYPKKKRKRSLSEKAFWNKLIDYHLHPHFKGPNAEKAILLDYFAHSLVEKNPEESRRKFIRYSLPKLIEVMDKEQEDKKYKELLRLAYLYSIFKSLSR
jgi:hypothetical protein